MSDSETFDFRPARIWGIVLEYKERIPGDIRILSYNSHSKIVHIEYQQPWTHNGIVETTEYGYGKFTAIRKMIERKPVSIRSWRKVSCRQKEWRKPDPRYDKAEVA